LFRSIPPQLRILLLLLVSGISSVVERSLLAATQQRQSPANASLFGLLNFALDGVKLFSKVLQTTAGSLLVLSVVLVLFAEAIFVDAQFGTTEIAILAIMQVPF
jgi:NADH:ubiquinone oxidoreductase subunit H